MQKYLLIFALSCLPAISGFTGCASGTSDLGAVNRTPAQTVFQIKQDYAAVLTIAVAYKRLPLCADSVTPLCSQKSVVTQLQKADDAAIAILDGAETAVRAGGGNVGMAITAATQAVATFSAVSKLIGSQ